MEETLSFEDFKKYVNKTIRFGEMKLKIYPKDGGHKIEVWEHDEYQYTDEDGKLINDGDVTQPFSIFTDEEGVIGVIEHGFGPMTIANKDDQIYMLNLIEKRVEIPSFEVLDAVPIDTTFQKQFKNLKKQLKEALE